MTCSLLARRRRGKVVVYLPALSSMVVTALPRHCLGVLAVRLLSFRSKTQSHVPGWSLMVTERLIVDRAGERAVSPVTSWKRAGEYVYGQRSTLLFLPLGADCRPTKRVGGGVNRVNSLFSRCVVVGRFDDVGFALLSVGCGGYTYGIQPR